jgi:hypothetical protein
MPAGQFSFLLNGVILPGGTYGRASASVTGQIIFPAIAGDVISVQNNIHGSNFLTAIGGTQTSVNASLRVARLA